MCSNIEKENEILDKCLELVENFVVYNCDNHDNWSNEECQSCGKTYNYKLILDITGLKSAIQSLKQF